MTETLSDRGRAPAPASATSLVLSLTVTRRTLLRTSTAAVALGVAGLSPQHSSSDGRGEPFDDGTLFDDGFGWRD